MNKKIIGNTFTKKQVEDYITQVQTKYDCEMEYVNELKKYPLVSIKAWKGSKVEWLIQKDFENNIINNHECLICLLLQDIKHQIALVTNAYYNIEGNMI